MVLLTELLPNSRLRESAEQRQARLRLREREDGEMLVERKK